MIGWEGDCGDGVTSKKKTGDVKPLDVTPGSDVPVHALPSQTEGTRSKDDGGRLPCTQTV